MILMDEDESKLFESPFFNRFEKHKLTFDSILSSEDKHLA